MSVGRRQSIVPQRSKRGPRGSAAFGNSRRSAQSKVRPSARELFEQLSPLLYLADAETGEVTRTEFRNVIEGGEHR